MSVSQEEASEEVSPADTLALDFGLQNRDKESLLLQPGLWRPDSAANTRRRRVGGTARLGHTLRGLPGTGTRLPAKLVPGQVQGLQLPAGPLLLGWHCHQLVAL